MSQIDDVRTGIHGMWATVTEGWEVHADENDVRA